MADKETEVFTPPSQDSIDEAEAAELILGMNRSATKRASAPAEKTPEPDAEEPAEEETEEEGDEEKPETEDEPEEKDDEEEEKDDEDEEKPDTDEANLHEVKVDGKVEKVTLDDLKKSYSFTSHLTRKSQAIAEEAKSLAAEKQATAVERAKYDNLLSQLEEALVGMSPEEPDWDKLYKENPVDFAVKRAQYDQQRERVAGIRAERAHVARLQQEHIERERGRIVREEQEKLIASRPEWKDEAVRTKDFAAMAEYAIKDYNYTPDDLKDITDSRLLVILDKARRYDELQKAKPETRRRVAEVIKTAKPGSATMTTKQAGTVKRLQQRAARSGSLEDAAELIFSSGLLPK